MTLNRIFKNLQRRTTGGYDTFHSFRKDKRGKRLEHKKARQNMKFYDGFEEFMRENRKNGGYDVHK